MSYDKKLTEAIEFIRKWEPKRGYFLAFSGGKDSIVTESLLKMAEVKYVAGYSCTTIDPPELMAFIRKHYPDVLWFRPERSFYGLVSQKCPPLVMKRWCCDALKEIPGKPFKAKYPIHVTGIRAEESRKRARRPQIDMHPRLTGTVNIKPIFSWKADHIWQHIKENKLPYPALYDEGFERLGCVICPMMFHRNQDKLNKHRNRWPNHYKAFERAVSKWYASKTDPDLLHDNFEDYLEAYYRGFEKPRKELKP